MSLINLNTNYSNVSLFNNRLTNPDSPAITFKDAALNYLKYKENTPLALAENGKTTSTMHIVGVNNDIAPTVGYGFNLLGHSASEVTLLLTHAMNPDYLESQAITWLAEWVGSYQYYGATLAGKIFVTWEDDGELVGGSTELTLTSDQLLSFNTFHLVNRILFFGLHFYFK